ncbi:cell wall integrity and stress response component 3-like [Sphaeramia orbicularis]|uniref:cell wall integrity and stress response component 3-like n=1 Tax=Sphaeramia orbicularis TaxID=375764 RepID=UPI00117F739A|nr:cell wall integrity and stress response component 3-like [Sphaeramia orbicularis]
MATKTPQASRGHKEMTPVYVLLISLLPLTASGAVTPDPTHPLTTGQVKFTRSQTTQDMRTQGSVSAQTFTLSKNIPTPSTPQTPSEKPTANPPTAQTAAYLSNSSSSPINNATKGTNFTTTSTTGFIVSEATSTTFPTVRSTSPSESQHTNMTPTPPVTFPSTNVNLMTSTLTKPAQNDSTTTFQVMSSGTKPSTSSYKTSTPTTKRPFIRTKKPNKKQDPPGKKQDTKNGKIVAGLIGGALVLMMIGFLVIYIKKRKLQKQQISTTNWAGPTPFLESGADNSQVTLRSSNRISISSFLPQRLSKRLSLLPEVGEEMEDITAGSTFGEKLMNQTKSSKDSPKTVETSVTSSQADNPIFMNNEAAEDHQDQDESPQTPSGKVDDPLGEQKDDGEQP